MNTISIVYSPDRFTSGHRIAEEHKLLFTSSPTKEVHLVVFSPFAAPSEPVNKIGDHMWVYQYNTRNIVFQIVSIVRKIFFIQKQDQAVKAPWTYADSGAKIGFVYKQIDVVLTDELLLSQVIGLLVAKKFKAVLSIIFVRDQFSFLLTSALSVTRALRTTFSRYLISQTSTVSLSTVLLQNRYTNMYKNSPSALEKMHSLPRYIDFEALAATPKTVDLHKKYPQFKFIIVLHTSTIGFFDLYKCLAIIKQIKPHFDFLGFVIVGNTESILPLKLMIESSKYKKYFAFEGSSSEWRSSPVSYFKSANLFIMRPDVYMYDTLLTYAFAATCPTISMRSSEIEQFFTGNDLFILDRFDTKEISKIILSIVNSPAEVKERVIAMKQGVSQMFGSMQLSYAEYITELYNSFLFAPKRK
jgi:hypothetical protein